MTGVSAQANLAIGSVQSMAVVVFCAYLKSSGVCGGVLTAVRGADTSDWFTSYTPAIRGFRGEAAASC